MRYSQLSLRTQLTLLVVLILAILWSLTALELVRSRQAALRDAEVRTSTQAQMFAEYSRSTLKRINEFILNTRGRWSGDWKAFAAILTEAQANIDDIVFQVAVIDQEGIMAFSNLAKPSDRTDLSEREHFRVHKEAGKADRLFISKPLLGKVSGKWSIQITRPLFREGQFAGVIVISVSPEQFTRFAENMNVSSNGTMGVVRDSGEIMARYPQDVSMLGRIVSNSPYLKAGAPVAGNFTQLSLEVKERIFGFYRLAEYGLNFVLGEAVDDVLAPYFSHRNLVLGVALFISLLTVSFAFAFYRSLAALEEARLHLATIFALSPDGFVSFNAQHRVNYVSPPFTSMTGLAEEDLVGLDEQVFARRLADLCTEQACFPDMAAFRSEQASLTAENPDRDLHDSPRLIELSTEGKRVLEVALRLSLASTVSQVLYFRDVTRETEVDRMKSEFMSTAAHELRTPMASIYGFAEVLLSQDHDEANRREFLEIIFRQAELMASILNELLDLARIEARRGMDFVFQSLPAATLVEEVLNGFRLPAGRSAPALTAPALPLSLSVDSKKAQQAILNVLSNAYKYSPAGSEVCVIIEARPAGVRAAMVAIRIVDQGIGMNPIQVRRICERFYRADTSGTVPGTGLGMSIVKEIVELHHGALEIDSKFGMGSSVTLLFPVIRSGPAANHPGEA